MTQNMCTKEVKHILFTSACKSSSKIEHMLGHKASLKKYKKIEMISNIFPDTNVWNQKLNTKRIPENLQIWGG